MSTPHAQSSTAPAYHLTVRGARGLFLDVELAVDDGLLAVELVLTRDAVEQLRERLAATLTEAAPSTSARPVAEDTRTDEDEREGEALFASRRSPR